MKKGLTPILSIIILAIFTVLISISILFYVKTIQPSEREVEAIRDITTTLTSYNPVILSESYKNNVLRVDIKNKGSRRMKLNESNMLLEIYKPSGEVVCQSEYLSPGGAFEANISEKYLSARGTVSLYIRINPFICNIKASTTYFYTIHFSSATSATGEYDTEVVFLTICGDNNPEGDEQCDDGNNVDCDPYPGCNGDCSLDQFCGNDVVECGEECDDGGTTGGDGCSATCTIELAGALCYSCDNCTAEIGQASSGDTIYLVDNISTTGRCIDFNGTDDVTFDCQGHNITGDDSGTTDYGIWLNNSNGGSDNNTVLNCKITDFFNGIYSTSASDKNTIKDTITNSNWRGIYFIYSDSSNFINVTANSNSQHGVYIMSDYNNITNITANSNQYGFYLRNSYSSSITNSKLLENELDLYVSTTTDNHCENHIENITGSGNRPIKYYKDTVNIQNWEGNISHIILCNASNSYLNNITIRGSDSIDNNGIIIAQTDGAHFENINNSNNEYIMLMYSNSNTFINITSYSSYVGIYMSSSDSNNFTNITANSNSYGIQMYSSDSNNFINVTANSNSQHGIFLYNSNSNIISESITNSNSYGVRLSSNSDNNIIANSTIKGNSLAGIYFDPSGSDYPEYNQIYNCLLNNSGTYDNVRFTGTPPNPPNYFNTTNKTGNRIYGSGTNIGGNVWINGSGDGYYYDCTDDDNDGFCDEAYDVYNDRACQLGSSTETVESKNDTGRYSSIAIDYNGMIHISYFNDTNDDLGYCNGTYGNWECKNLKTTGNVGYDSSIAIDSTNVVHISYYNETGGNLGYCNNSGGTWTCDNVATNGVVGEFSSIAIDSNDVVHISHKNATVVYSLGYCNNSGGSWTCENVDLGGMVGDCSSIAIDSNNVVHISHTDAGNDDLRYCNNSGGTWTCKQIGDGGKHTSIAIDSNDVVHVSSNNGSLSYCNNSGGSWTCENVETTGDVGWDTSIAIDSNDVVYISHYDATNDDLRYCYNSAGSWSCVKLANAGSTWLGYPNGRNLAVKKGRLVDSTSDSDVSISWYNNTDLMHTRIISNCSANTDYLPLSD
ncbi:MAG: right-handed parallel beta-helix repeat-containing protein [Candidatus Woesearchaeota archaeon]|nr:MAG: right-handed parallel beta-helix repeat-containing protein [Candidatus Woesearchaeota archaeon]